MVQKGLLRSTERWSSRFSSPSPLLCVTDASRAHGYYYRWAIVCVTDAWDDRDMSEQRKGRKPRCQHCRKAFELVKPWQKHCSEQCRKMSYAHTNAGRKHARERARRYRRRLRRKRKHTAHGMRMARLRLSMIRMDFQPAENLIEETVLMYVDRLQRGETLPSVRVRFDGNSYFLEDGFHRAEATRRCGRKTLRAEILLGTLNEMQARFGHYLKCLRAELAKGTR